MGTSARTVLEIGKGKGEQELARIVLAWLAAGGVTAHVEDAKAWAARAGTRDATDAGSPTTTSSK